MTCVMWPMLLAVAVDHWLQLLWVLVLAVV